MDPVARIEIIFRQQGHQRYEGARAESVSALEHALQCAQMAEWSEAPDTLVAAALLHDIGHFIGTQGLGDQVDDTHEHRALPLLTQAFGAAVAEPVRLHVAAKRFLVSASPSYAAGLSPASVHSLALQGGPMTPREADAFEDLPFAQQAVQLRRWDDLAKTPGKPTPPLDYYLSLLEQLSQRRRNGADISAVMGLER